MSTANDLKVSLFILYIIFSYTMPDYMVDTFLFECIIFPLLYVTLQTIFGLQSTS